LSHAKRGPIKLILGPWIHGEHMHSAHGEVDFGPAAAIDGYAFRLRWYDRWLKGVTNGAENDAPVRIFVMGGGSEARTLEGRHLHGGVWRDEHEWPLARTRWTPYYLHADGSLSPESPREPRSSTSYSFDPHDPVPTIGGNISSAVGIMQQGAWDQKCGPQVWNCTNALPLSTRRDVLVFQTPPLAQDVEVTGPIDVKLWASSSVVDTDFTAKLIDVHPPTADSPAGIDMNLEDGIIRARFRDEVAAEFCKTAGQPCAASANSSSGARQGAEGAAAPPELMHPGEIYQFIIQLYPTSNLFKKGHRIRLDVSSSNFPRFDVNPNTGEPLNQQRRFAIAVNTIYHDAQHPSHVVLPIIPVSSVPLR
jgi:putative CocE/NonD family hydrolase